MIAVTKVYSHKPDDPKVALRPDSDFSQYMLDEIKNACKRQQRYEVTKKYSLAEKPGITYTLTVSYVYNQD